MATILNAFAHQQGVISQSKNDDTAILPSQFSIPKQGQTGFAAAEWELENGVVVGAGDFKRRKRDAANGPYLPGVENAGLNSGRRYAATAR